MPTPAGQPQTEASPAVEPELITDYSSSDSSVEVSPRPCHKTMTCRKKATVYHRDIAHPPLMSDGKVTPAVVEDFESSCDIFFMNAKGISEEQKVSRLFASFKNPHIKEWISVERTTLADLTFPDFMKVFRKRWLPGDWDITLLAKILRTTLDPIKETFEAWVRRVQILNITLRGSPRQLTETELRSQLVANLDEELRTMAKDEVAYKIKELHPWIRKVRLLDDKRRYEHKRTNKYIEEYFRTMNGCGR